MAKKQEKHELVLVDEANELIISGQSTYDEATEILKMLKKGKKNVEETLDPQCKSAHVTWKTALEQKKKHLKPLEDAEKLIKGKISDYLLLEERRKDEEIKKLEAEEEERRQELEEKAEEAEATGDEELADTLREEAEAPMPVAVAPTVNKSSNISTASDYDIEIKDIKGLMEWMLKQKFLDPSTVFNVKIGGLKTFRKMAGLTAIPGCKLTLKKKIGIL